MGLNDLHRRDFSRANAAADFCNGGKRRHGHKGTARVCASWMQVKREAVRESSGDKIS
jgi:hypothetical protein